MVVFSAEFGSEEPFLDAVRAAAAMSQYDVHAFCPHIGIASGRVIVGYAGTALRYNVSVFGAPVALAARCAGVKPAVEQSALISSSIVMPAEEWDDRVLRDLLPPRTGTMRDGRLYEEPSTFELRPSREVAMKGLGTVAVREIHNDGMHFPSQTVENRSLEGLYILHQTNRYWPRWEPPEPGAGEWGHVSPLETDD